MCEVLFLPETNTKITIVQELLDYFRVDVQDILTSAYYSIGSIRMEACMCSVNLAGTLTKLGWEIYHPYTTELSHKYNDMMVAIPPLGRSMYNSTVWTMT